MIYAIGISGIPAFARMMRANILTIRDSEYIEAASSINCTTFRIITRHVIPNAIAPLIVQVAMGIASAALAASGLSFLGFGVQAPTPEWGRNAGVSQRIYAGLSSHGHHSRNIYYADCP